MDLALIAAVVSSHAQQLLQQSPMDDPTDPSEPASGPAVISQWHEVENDPAFNEGWYLDMFCCSRKSFSHIAGHIESNWRQAHNRLPGFNSVFDIRCRTAVAMHYLCHSSSLVESAKVFGMSKPSASRYVWEVIDVIEASFSQIVLPKTPDEWRAEQEGFKAICGFPNTYLAIDGSLFEIERPHDFEGWYCLKGYPAFNVQLVADHRKRIRD